jgi:transposase
MTIEERNRKIVQAYLKGETYTQVAQRFGITRNAVAGVISRAGIRLSPEQRSAKMARQGRRKEERNAEVVALYKTGKWSQRALGERFGVSHSVIAQILDLYQIPRLSPASKRIFA